jgi:hypothetical protein
MVGALLVLLSTSPLRGQAPVLSDTIITEEERASLYVTPDSIWHTGLGFSIPIPGSSFIPDPTAQVAIDESVNSNAGSVGWVFSNEGKQQVLLIVVVKLATIGDSAFREFANGVKQGAGHSTVLREATQWSDSTGEYTSDLRSRNGRFMGVRCLGRHAGTGGLIACVWTLTEAIEELALVRAGFRLVPGGSGNAHARRPQVDGRRLRLTTDSFVMYLVKGSDTSRMGLASDELRVDGEWLVRVFQDEMGTADTIVSRYHDLHPRENHSHYGMIAHLRFNDTVVTGSIGREGSDRSIINEKIPADAYDAMSFDAIIRASDLTDSTHFVITAIGAGGQILTAEARVIGSEQIDGRDCWVISARMGDTPEMYRIDKRSRQLMSLYVESSPGEGALLTAIP